MAALATSATAGWANTVTMATVPVGDAGNQADTTGYGQVNYNYQIGTYDVTDNQYAAFLQAVAGTIDPYGLWNNLMENDPDGGGSEGGISRTGNGPYTYSVKPGQGNQPVACETWLDAVRFVNWLSNGQGTGSTESGPYTITGGGYNSGTVTVPTASQRATWGAGGSGVVWLLPTANEWYKAAYYKGGSTNAGYWLYPYQSNTPPTSQAPPGGSNSANIFSSTTGFALTQSTSYVDTQDYLTDVNAYGSSLGPYGTVGQGGNVFQWDEALIGSARGRAGRVVLELLERLGVQFGRQLLRRPNRRGADDRLPCRTPGNRPSRPVGGGRRRKLERCDQMVGRRAQCRRRGGVISARPALRSTINLNEPVTLGTLLLGAGTPGVGYTLSGSGSNTLKFSNTSNGFAATITITDGTHFIAAQVVLASNLVVTSTSSKPWQLSFGTAGSITETNGAQSLTMNGESGTLTLSGSNSYLGGTTIDAGVLVAGAANSLSASSAVTINGGTLDASGFANTVASLNVTGSGSLNLGLGNTLTCSGTRRLGRQLNVSGTGTLGKYPLLAYSQRERLVRQHHGPRPELRPALQNDRVGRRAQGASRHYHSDRGQPHGHHGRHDRPDRQRHAIPPLRSPTR